MPEISPEELIAQFTELVTPFLVVPHPETRLILNALLEFYRQTRVRGASLDADGDILLVHWGAKRPPLTDGVEDMRRLSDAELRWEPAGYRSFSIGRQVFPAADDPEGELDDSGFILGLDCFFQLDNERPSTSHIWILTPSDIPAKITSILNDDYVAPLISSVPSRISSHISGAG